MRVFDLRLTDKGALAGTFNLALGSLVISDCFGTEREYERA